MDKINLPVGISDFAEVRERDYYYIDKTDLISELLEISNAKITLITRPRRFGKTLVLSMLSYFFDIRKSSNTLFKGLHISQNTSLCQAWMNQYPVLFLTFKDVSGLNFSSAKEMLGKCIIDLCNEHYYLGTSTKVNINDQRTFLHLASVTNGELTDFELKTGLSLLMRMMHAHYGKPVILLLDEYDVPLAKASNSHYYNEMMEIIRVIMSTTLKDNPHLCFAVITGCLRIAKESIFTETNNLVVDTISSTRLKEYFGFTENDVEQLLADAHMQIYKSQIKSWYDGYHFGDIDIYCPWDVINYIRDLQSDPGLAPVSYWKNTSDNGIIRSFIDYSGNSITMKLETLMSGNYIIQHLEESLTYDYLHSSEDNLWTILYFTGYLTAVPNHQITEKLRPREKALAIPNAEIREIFETTIIKWFDDTSRIWNKEFLFHSVWSRNPGSITLELTKLLRKTISYHDYKEDFYHAFLAGIFAGAGYVVKSNRESGERRSDVVIHDPANGRVVIFEVKISQAAKDMEMDCKRALKQIQDHCYPGEFEDEYDQILCYGITFFKKRCLVMSE